MIRDMLSDSLPVAGATRIPDQAHALPAPRILVPSSLNSGQSQLAMDRDLVKRTLSGCEKSREVFVHRMRCIPRFLFLRSRHSGLSREELSDLAQDVFAAIWDRLDSYRGTAPLEAWVHAFCVNAIANALRKHASRPLESSPNTLNDFPAETEEAEDLRLDPLRKAFLELGEPQREILRLHSMQSLTYQEISISIGCSERAARARYQRALVELRELLNQRGLSDLPSQKLS